MIEFGVGIICLLVVAVFGLIFGFLIELTKGWIFLPLVLLLIYLVGYVITLGYFFIHRSSPFKVSALKAIRAGG